MAACHSTEAVLPSHPLLLGGDALTAERTSDGRWLPSYRETVTLPNGGAVKYLWYGWIVEGRCGALVAAGVVPAHWFERTAARGRLWYPRVESVDGRKVRIRGCGRDRVTITVEFSDADRAVAYKNGQAVTVPAAVAANEGRLPSDQDDFRSKAAAYAEAVFELLRRLGEGRGGAWGGYRFAPDVLEDLDDLRDDLLAVLRNGAVRFDRATHEARVRQFRAPLAKIDDGLQSFLAKVTETAC